MPEPDAPAESGAEPWRQQPGEPSINVTTQNGVLIVQSMANGLSAALIMRADVGIWLGKQLQSQGELLKSGIIIPGPGPIPPLTGPNGRPA